MTNYERHQKAISCLSVTDLIRVYDYVNLLCNLVNKENEVLDDRMDILYPIDLVLTPLKTEKSCPRCGLSLFMSDLEQYDYVCESCEENFYEGEVN